MASVTCGLTAEDRDQLRNPTLLLRMGLSYLCMAEAFSVNDLCVHVQMVSARRSSAQGCQPPPPLVCLEINEVGIKMTERTQV